MYGLRNSNLPLYLFKIGDWPSYCMYIKMKNNLKESKEGNMEDFGRKKKNNIIIILL